MALKCVHKGCGKTFTDDDEPCTYHPGPPEFHEGQKGWKCCKARVLTFDEFLTIPPCTTGKHSTIDDTPAPEPKPLVEDALAPTAKPPTNGAPLLPPPPARVPKAALARPPTPPPPESDSDEPSAQAQVGATCKRRGCSGTYDSAASSRDAEECTYHPGQALFHEGSKGWTCCKRRVLEFDEFMRIPGCKTRKRHCFVGKRRLQNGEGGAVEKVETLRSDYYQTSTTVHASMYLKKIDKAQSRIVFAHSGAEVELDLRTSDAKCYRETVPLFGKIDPGKSSFRVLGTKLELTLAKADGAGWPVLRADEKPTGEIIQTGRAGMA